MMARWTGRIVAIAVVVAIVGAAVFWWNRPKPAPAATAPPTPQVGVVEVKAADVALPLDFSGRVAGFRVVEIRAQVSGVLLKREYQEGAVVDVGQVLFRIDPRTYEAALARANAQAAQARATLIQAEENFKRQEGLAAQRVATQKAYEDAVAVRDQARAAVLSTEADVLTAKLNIEFTTIKAPAKGPTSLVSPAEGTLIQAQQTLLTTITQLDPAYVNFTFTDSELRQLQEIDKSPEELFDSKNVKVELQFGDGAVYPQTGTVDTRSRTVDPRTGTILTRAIFPNRDGALLPGQFVRVKMTGIVMPNAIVIPKIAISQGPLGPFVYVIEKDNVARARPVRIYRELPDGYIVRKGLAAGDRIVVDGVIRVRPGNVVNPVPFTAARRGRQAMISKFFIDRPVFASVLSIVIVLAGLVAMRVLPISQYPQIVPPEVVVSATYPGATAETVAATVAAPLEQQINGVERMIYMQSTSTGSGTMSLTVTFEIGTNPDQNAINVNNRVQRALPLLPGEVSRQGLVVQKRSTSILQVITMSSPDDRYDTIYISNYALVNVLDELRRLPGVGDAALFGASDYSMRIWLRPDKLAQYNLTPADVAGVVREQNQQFAAGRFGEEPMNRPQVFTYSVTTPPRLVDRTQFEDIIIRSEENGGALRLKDVARVELGALTYGFSGTFNGSPAVPIARLPAARRQRHPGGGDGEGGHGAHRQALPRRPALRHPVRHHALRRGLDRGGRHHLRRGDRAGGAGRLPVPAERAGDDHPGHRHPGVDHRHLRRHVRAGLLDQPADAVRPGAGDRHRRRRRHRGAGERRAHHVDAKARGRARPPSRPCRR